MRARASADADGATAGVAVPRPRPSGREERRPRRLRRQVERGQALVETALAFPILVLAAYAMVQVVLYVHARTVVVAAVQEGARAAVTGGDGMGRAREVLQAGLGPSGRRLFVNTRIELGATGGEAWVVSADGTWPVHVGLTRIEVPLRAEARVSGEFFRGGPPGGPGR
ncbi:MAG: pilus assembly protein [Chloroflexi bacterium]|nr:pilus assembly protein [Chloroflexota bacterium]